MHLTCGEDLAKDLFSDLRRAARSQAGRSRAAGGRTGSILAGRAALLLFRAGTQEPAHFQGERGDALNFHENKSATKAEHELFPLRQLRRTLQAPASQHRDQIGAAS